MADADPVVVTKKSRTPAKRRPAGRFDKPADVLLLFQVAAPSPIVVPESTSSQSTASPPSSSQEVRTGKGTQVAGKSCRRKQATGKMKRRRVLPCVEALSRPWPTDWSDLPLAALGAVASLLLGRPPDLGSFSAVCQAWRSAAGVAKTAAFSSGRPLLLLPPSPSHDACRFYSLPVAGGGGAYGGGAYGGRRTIGFSHRHLVVFDDDTHRPLLVSLSDGKETWFPRTAAHTYSYYGVLTAVPEAPGGTCVLLLFCMPEGGLQHCRVGEETWSLHQFASAGWFFAAAEVVGNKVYALSNLGHLMVMDLLSRRRSPGGSSAGPFRLEEEHVEVEGFPGRFPHGGLPPVLVRKSRGEEMLLIAQAGMRTEFYRLDWSARRWVKEEGTGEGAVRVRYHGCSVSFVPPTRWRMRQNTLQVRESGAHGLQMKMPLQGSRVNDALAKPEWPSPVWVLLSMQ